MHYSPYLQEKTIFKLAKQFHRNVSWNWLTIIPRLLKLQEIKNLFLSWANEWDISQFNWPDQSKGEEAGGLLFPPQLSHPLFPRLLLHPPSPPPPQLNSPLLTIYRLYDGLKRITFQGKKLKMKLEVKKRSTNLASLTFLQQADCPTASDLLVNRSWWQYAGILSTYLNSSFFMEFSSACPREQNYSFNWMDNLKLRKGIDIIVSKHYDFLIKSHLWGIFSCNSIKCLACICKILQHGILNLMLFQDVCV